MATWPKVKLADCVNLLAGFPFKSQQFTDKPDDLPLVKGENVSQGCILWDISKRWPALDWDKLEKFHLLPCAFSTRLGPNPPRMLIAGRRAMARARASVTTLSTIGMGRNSRAPARMHRISRSGLVFAA